MGYITLPLVHYIMCEWPIIRPVGPIIKTAKFVYIWSYFVLYCMWCFAVVFSFIQLINDVAVQTTDGIRLMNVCDNNNLHVCSDLLVVSGASRGADDGDEFPPAYNSVFARKKYRWCIACLIYSIVIV